MSEEGFLRRWSRMKAQPQQAGPAAEAPDAAPLAEAEPEPHLAPLAETAPRPAVPPSPPAAPSEVRLPTLDDVAALTSESDFSAFVAHGVDKTVQRLAMKKLFADPHFRLMDGLDIYIDDYNKAGAVSAAMLASLDHAKSVFRQFVNDDEQADRIAGPDGSPGTSTGTEPQPRPPESDDA